MRALEWVRDRAIALYDDPGAVAWMLLVAFVYGGATFVRSQASSWGSDHMMILASDLFVGRSDLSSLTTINDIVTINGRNYQAMSLLPTVPYLPLVPFAALWPFSRWIVSAVIGIVAGWLALPIWNCSSPPKGKCSRREAGASGRISTIKSLLPGTG